MKSLVKDIITAIDQEMYTVDTGLEYNDDGELENTLGYLQLEEKLLALLKGRITENRFAEAMRLIIEHYEAIKSERELEVQDLHNFINDAIEAYYKEC